MLLLNPGDNGIEAPVVERAKPERVLGSEGSDDFVAHPTITMKLDRQIKTLGAHSLDEFPGSIEIVWDVGQTGIAGKRLEAVEELGQSGDEIACPREAD